MMRKYLAHCLDEEPRIFRMLDLISRELRVMVLSIFSLSLLPNQGLLGKGRRRVGFGFLSLP